VAFTYSEPTSYYEYGLDTVAAARAAGLRGVWVSNGYIARAPLDRLCRQIDAAAVNLKSFEDRIYLDLNGGHLRPVMDTLVRMKENGVWLEVINLVILTYTDDPEMIRRMCDWYLKALGPDTPLHFSRFTPLYKPVHLAPTPVEVLARAGHRQGGGATACVHRQGARAGGEHRLPGVQERRGREERVPDPEERDQGGEVRVLRGEGRGGAGVTGQIV
jgi:pyruvate-formate lyase-activating enzyme